MPDLTFGKSEILNESNDRVSEDLGTMKKAGKRMKVGNSNFSEHSGRASLCHPLRYSFLGSKAPALCFGVSSRKWGEKVNPPDLLHLASLKESSICQQGTFPASNGSKALSSRQQSTEDQTCHGEGNSDAGCNYEASTRPHSDACRACAHESKGLKGVCSSATESALQNNSAATGCDLDLWCERCSNTREFSVEKDCEAQVLSSWQNLHGTNAVLSTVGRLNKSLSNFLLDAEFPSIYSKHQVLHMTSVIPGACDGISKLFCVDFEDASDSYLSARQFLNTLTTTRHHPLRTEISEIEIMRCLTRLIKVTALELVRNRS